MNKPVKITLISLASLLLVVVLAIVVVVNFVFTSSRLTPVVRAEAAKYLTCDMQLDEVDLTFFSTFPEFGLRISELSLINPKAGAPSDTLAHLGECVAIIDVMAFLSDNHIDIKQFRLDRVQANLYVAPDSTTNFDVVALTPDTTAADTTCSSSITLGDISLQGITVAHLSGSYVDATTGMDARFSDLNLALDAATRVHDRKLDFKAQLDIALLQYDDAALAARVGNLHVDECDISIHDRVIRLAFDSKFDTLSYATLGDTVMQATLGPTAMRVPSLVYDDAWQLEGDFSLRDLTFAMTQTGTLVSHRPLDLKLKAAVDTTFTHFSLTDGFLSFADEQLTFAADVEIPDTATLHADVSLGMATTSFGRLLSLVPAAYSSSLSEIQLGGDLKDLNVRASIEQHQGVLDILSFDFSTALQGVDVAMNAGKMQAQMSAFTLEGRYPVESKQMKAEKQTQQAKRQKHTHNKRRSKAVKEARFMSATLHAEQIYFLMDDSSRIEATLPDLNLQVTLSDEILIDANSLPFISADFAFTGVDAAIDTITVATHGVEGGFSMADGMRGMKKYYEVNFSSNDLDVKMGSDMSAVTGPLRVDASSVYDFDQQDFLLRYNPVLNVNLQQGNIAMAAMPFPIIIPTIDFDFNLGEFMIRDSQVRMGNSDFRLQGDIRNINDFLSDEGLLTAELNLKSQTTDVYQLMDLVNGIGVTDTTATAQPEVVTAATDSAQSAADPFMVPKGVDVVLNTQIDQALVGENVFSNLAGQVTVRDGVLVLEEMGFSSKAARMQLTALYRSDYRDHLFVGANFHLLDIEVHDLIHMIPDIDTIVPMLKSFDGKGEFHLAAETNLNANYELKMSTLKAVAAIEGKDLVVLDNETFSTISKFLMFNKKTENKVDSIAVEMAVARRKATLYPMLIAMDKYQAVVSGMHNLTGDMGFNYHISLTDCPLPVKLGLDIHGDMVNPDGFSFDVVKCKYGNLYKPEKRNVTQEMTLSLKSLISTSLKRTVKTEATGTLLPAQ